MGVSVSAIAAKLDAWEKSDDGQKKIREIIKDIQKSKGHSGKTGTGDIIVTHEQMEAAAKDFISMIRKHAASSGIPDSVMGHIESFQDSPLVENPDGSVKIEINMLDNPRRESVQPSTYQRGSDNIVAAFNVGYSAKGQVFGQWETAGKSIWTLKHRDGLYFLQRAVEEFNAKYGKKYNVTVTLDSQYE